MQKKNFSGKVQELIDRASSGNIEDVDYILDHLTPDVTLSVTKFVDYALSLVVSDVGIEKIEYYFSMARKYNAIIAHCFSIEEAIGLSLKRRMSADLLTKSRHTLDENH